jgi:hypothetical protein
MSTPKDFSRLDDRPGRKNGGKPDRFEQFKAKTGANIRYREAYNAAQQRGVSVAGLPHPDRATDDEAERGLAALAGQGGPAKVQAVPGVDVQG